VKECEIIAANLSKVGWSWGCVSALDSEGRTIWIVEHVAATESVSWCGRMKIDCVSGTGSNCSLSHCVVLTAGEILSKLGVAKRV
jgi:hypothetical protein